MIDGDTAPSDRNRENWPFRQTLTRVDPENLRRPNLHPNLRRREPLHFPQPRIPRIHPPRMRIHQPHMPHTPPAILLQASPAPPSSGHPAKAPRSPPAEASPGPAQAPADRTLQHPESNKAPFEPSSAFPHRERSSPDPGTPRTKAPEPSRASKSAKTAPRFRHPGIRGRGPERSSKDIPQH